LGVWLSPDDHSVLRNRYRQPSHEVFACTEQEARNAISSAITPAYQNWSNARNHRYRPGRKRGVIEKAAIGLFIFFFAIPMVLWVVGAILHSLF